MGRRIKYTKLYSVNLNGKDYLEDLNIEKCCEVIDWIYFAQNTVQWRTLLKTVMNFRLHKSLSIFSPAERLSASQAGVCSVELYYNMISGWRTIHSHTPYLHTIHDHLPITPTTFAWLVPLCSTHDLGSTLGPVNRYFDWGSWWFSSAPLGKCQDCILNFGMTTCFEILYSSPFSHCNILCYITHIVEKASFHDLRIELRGKVVPVQWNSVVT